MSSFRTLLYAGVLCAAIAGAASAEPTNSTRTPLINLLASTAISRGPQDTASSLQNVTLRGGVMVRPRGAGLAGVEIALPSSSFGNGWSGRLDADVIFKANFAGVNTAIPVTFNQIHVSPGADGQRTTYWGAGVGAVLGGSAKFGGKLIFGTDLTSKLGAEVNVHYTKDDTLVCLVGRIKL